MVAVAAAASCLRWCDYSSETKHTMSVRPSALQYNFTQADVYAAKLSGLAAVAAVFVMLVYVKGLLLLYVGGTTAVPA